VQQHLQNQLARELLAGAIDDGQHVVVTRSDGGEREFDFGI
jgi:ATP-dependent Clp protease ATP-binding subunit ClpA